MRQGSQEWFKIRCGKVTASHFKEVISKGKTRMTYLLKLAAERTTGVVQPTFQNEAMRWGSETEPQARAYYERVTGNKVEQVGFVELNEYVGVSPDGIVGDGLLEVKCPNTATHIGYMKTGKLPSTYKAQVQGQMWVADKQWCEFVSFDPRCSEPYFCIRVERDDDYIAGLIESTREFVMELKKTVSGLGEAKEIKVAPNWDEINLGKCRHGILCALISSGMWPVDDYLDDIENLAYFSMKGRSDETNP
ncbi:MAG: exonuclease [Chloroflexi bacterium]|nr:MAG: exonuclease [Chloroflexota bacterium]